MFKKYFMASIIYGAFLSVAAIASPVSVSSFEVQVASSDKLEVRSTAPVELVIAMPYVVDLTVATHVPIASGLFTDELIDSAIREAVIATDAKLANYAVMQNSNFERQR